MICLWFGSSEAFKAGFGKHACAVPQISVEPLEPRGAASTSVVSVLRHSRVRTSEMPHQKAQRIRYANSERDWRGSDGAKAKLNQINCLYMRPNPAKGKAGIGFYFCRVK